MLKGKKLSTSGRKRKEQTYNLKIEASEETVLKVICRSKYIGGQMLSFPSKMHSKGPQPFLISCVMITLPKNCPNVLSQDFGMMRQFL